MRLYQFPFSPFAIKVRSAFTIKAVAVELVDITLERYAELLRLNPRAKAPVLVDGERAVADSTVILAELETRCPDPPLVPRDPARRALTWLLEDWADESLYWFATYFQVRVTENMSLVRTLYARNYSGNVGEQVASQMTEIMREQTHQQGIGRKPLSEVETDLARHTQMLTDLLAGARFFGGTAPDLADCALYGQARYLARTPQGARLIVPPALGEWFRRMHTFDLAGVALEPYAGQ